MIERALVIGAGIAGMQAALDIANSGYEVVLVEKEPSIGGRMAQLSETFPTLDCSQCILTPRTVEVGHHDNIRLYTYSQVESVARVEDPGSGMNRAEAANRFQVCIRRRAAYVDWDVCTGCGVCQEKCPFKIEARFEQGLGSRKVIYTLSPQAVPNKPVIDADNCRYLQSKWDIEAGRIPPLDKKGRPAKPRCGACAKFCPAGAIAWDQQDQIFEEEVGAIIVATGYDLFPQTRLKAYGGGRIADVIDGLAFERLLAASGPTAGRVQRPSDGQAPKEVVFVQCSGSRDPEHGVPYCSKICCMYTAKQAILYKHRVPDGQAYVFYIDVRAGGKGYEEFVNRAQEEEGIVYLRGKVSKLFRENGQVMVKGVDTLSNRTVEIAADLVVLATAVVPRLESREIAQMLGLATDEGGFFNASDEELSPLESGVPGVFLAGAALGPKDIPETVAQASGAAAKVLALFRRGRPGPPNPPEGGNSESATGGEDTTATLSPHLGGWGGPRRWGITMPRIGVFICHCGHNIAGTVDVAAVAEQIRQHPDVAFADDYKYMCSDPGQQLIRDSIAEHNLDGVVVAACSPAMHEVTFQRTAAGAGVNPYRCESANIREQVSWVHQHNQAEATHKALQIVRAVVEKVKGNEALTPFKLPLTRRVLIIGGGIAGMQAALDIAEAGYPVILVERRDQLGGKMAQLSGTYLNFEAAPDLLQKKIETVTHHPHIQVLTRAEVQEASGYVGNFQVVVNTADNPETPSSTSGDFKESGHSFTFDVGAIIVATGWERYDQARLPEYGGAGLPDVIDTLAFEGMLARGAEIRRPSDGQTPREVVFVQCAGSRDPERGVPYCSKVCCMVVAKQARLYRERVPEGQAYVFYIDIRSAGKGYDEYVQEAMEDHQVLYLRGKVSKIFQEGDKLIVWGADTLSGRAVEIAADLVVLATPMVPSPDAAELGRRLRVSTDIHGFFNEAHPKLRPVETLTAGVFVAGAGQGPKDIPETVAQASGAAAKVLQLFSRDHMTQSPLVATVIEELCAACGACVVACPYGAREIHPVRQIATVNAALCQNCGACVVACLNKASQVHNWRPKQILAMVDEVV